jgi:LacI family transcriptional regulator
VTELLLRRIEGKVRPPERVIVPTSIIQRGSVGPPFREK